MFITVRKKIIIYILSAILCVAGIVTFFSIVKPTTTPATRFTIAIDAGHGGRDGGCVGESGITESELNLMYARKLASLCEEFGMRVVMTRKDMNGLYDENASNKKRSEMEKRRQIINDSGADVMVSIHMNSFPLESSEGAHIFYAKGSEQGFDLAKSVQTSVCANFENARKYVTVGDYYVLNFSEMPSILIECGFLSNPTEEKLLQSEEYCEKFCYSVLAGVLSYFEM